MEQFIQEVETYAAAIGRKPQGVLRAAVGASWGSWDNWRSGKASPTMAVADRIRLYMAENPPPAEPEQARDVA
ncbi:hypothetical protein GCM10011452_09380 [Gemmobacter lanyuensis]|uniref:Uncharacterized protein n=1 Tax=Gemmobacter lanyuensis TaxID=1054497 RepID=A0A918MI39_9RHOB|nr:hypothetical protein [Gemmobacter lanyuensis]GGW24083.1 hypothetical protein GCM10011452_09380 [Gemmobacter lanyuensis]